MSAIHIEASRMLAPNPRERVCRDCSVPLSVSNMYPSCLKRSQWVCKECWNGRFYLAAKKHRYGLSEAEFVSLCESQGWCCAICSGRLAKRAACVDHDHATGAVRGVLCKKCNSGLGMFCDDEALLQCAVEYMRKRRAK